MFSFNKENHTYTLGGVRLPSVTEILKFGGLGGSRYFTEEGRIRGQAVHHAVFLEIDGDLNYGALHPKIKPYVDAWLAFKKQTRFRPIRELCEGPQFHNVLLYGGTPDVVGYLNGRAVVLDVKTGDATTAKYQTAAYREFPRIAAFGPSRFDLRLRPDGLYRLNEHRGANDWAVFVAHLSQYRSVKYG